MAKEKIDKIITPKFRVSFPKVLTPAQLEKVAKGVLEKDALLPYIEKPDKGLLEKDALLPYIEKPDKGLSLVPDSDPRQLVKSSASDDFKDL